MALVDLQASGTLSCSQLYAMDLLLGVAVPTIFVIRIQLGAESEFYISLPQPDPTTT